MKKLVSVLLAVSISFGVCGCGTASIPSDKAPDSSTISSAAPKRTAMLGEITSKSSSEEDTSASSEALSSSSEPDKGADLPEEESRTEKTLSSSAADEASSSSSSSVEISPEDWAAGNLLSPTEASSSELSEPEISPSAPEPEPDPVTPQQESEPAAQPKKSSGGGGNANNFNTYDNAEQQRTEATWVLNTKSKKIHYPSCSDVKKIAPQNYSTSDSTESELMKQGYTTCGHCHK